MNETQPAREQPNEHTGHTLGPWSLELPFFESSTFNIRDTAGRWLADVKPYGTDGFTGREEAEANARLIAAAPDLLEACKELRDVAAACFRVINEQGEAATFRLELEYEKLGIAEGFGVRAQLIIAKAEGLSPDSAASTADK